MTTLQRQELLKQELLKQELSGPLRCDQDRVCSLQTHRLEACDRPDRNRLGGCCQGAAAIWPMADRCRKQPRQRQMALWLAAQSGGVQSLQAVPTVRSRPATDPQPGDTGFRPTGSIRPWALAGRATAEQTAAHSSSPPPLPGSSGCSQIAPVSW